MEKHALFLILFAALSASAFCQGTEAVKVYSSGTDKGKFTDPNVITANSGTGAHQFANGATTQTALNGKVDAIGGSATNLTLGGIVSPEGEDDLWFKADRPAVVKITSRLKIEHHGSPFNGTWITADNDGGVSVQSDANDWIFEIPGLVVNAAPSDDGYFMVYGPADGIGTISINVDGNTTDMVYNGTSAFSITVPPDQDITLATSGSGAVKIAAALESKTLKITEQAIASSATPTWDVNAGQNATFTATSAATFTILNLAAGQTGTLSITQTSGTTGYVMTFPAGTKQAFGGTNTYQMSGTNVTDILYFYRTGTNIVITGVVPGITP